MCVYMQRVWMRVDEWRGGKELRDIPSFLDSDETDRTDV